MDNILSLAERTRREAKPYKCMINVVALITILEVFEIWACGWCLITLLSPEDYGNLWEGKNGSIPFKEIKLRYEYTYCVISFLAFHLVYLVPAILLLWGNRGNKVLAFLVFSIASAAALLLSIAVTVYFLTQNYDKAFLIISAPEDPKALPHFLLFLYFSRYFFIGWIVKLAFIMCTGMRRREIEEDKDVDIQTAVDKAFKSVFEEQDADSLKDDHKTYAGLGQDHVQPELIPEKIHRIPRAKAGSAQQLNSGHDVDAVYQARQAASIHGYVNQGFEHDVAPLSPRHVTEDRDYMNTRPQSRVEQDKLSDTRSRHVEEGHRRNHSQDTRQSRDSTLALRPASHYELQDRQRVVPEPYDQRRREDHSREATHKEYPRKDQPRRETAYRNDDTAAQIAYEAKRRSPEYQEYTPGVNEPRNECGRPLPRSRTSVANRQDSSPRSNGEPPQDYSPRGQSPPVQYVNRRPDYPGTRPQHDQDRRRLEHVQSNQRASRTEPREFEYDNRSRSAQDSPPGRDFEMRESRPGMYAGRDIPRGASPQGYESDPGSGRQDERRQRNPKPRPVSAYNARDSGRFDYGPGPLGYEVSSPNQRARSPVADDEEPRVGDSMSLNRDGSIVRQISPRYDSNIGGGLRTGPPPVGGVPAIGPASIRRVPARNMQYY